MTDAKQWASYPPPTGRSPRCNLHAPRPADPDEPHRVQRSHLEKTEIGKSRGSCKLSFVMRLHRRAVLQEFWCASFEEAAVLENIAAHPDVINIKEQLTRVDYVDANGAETFTKVDAHVLLANGNEVLVSVKYDEKARRASYLAEVSEIASQCSADIADSFVVLSRYMFHPAWRDCAEKIYHARRGWDPDADDMVLDVANRLSSPFSMGKLVETSGLGARGWRAAVRLIGDGDIRKNPRARVDDQLMCWRAA